MKLNLDFQIKDFDGKEFEGEANNASMIVGSQLWQARIKDVSNIKLDYWALLLWQRKPLEIDETDLAILSSIIEVILDLNVLTRAQIMKFINDVKDKEKKKLDKTSPKKS